VGSLFQSADDFAVFVNGDLPQQVDFFALFTLGQLYYWERACDRALAALDQAIAAAEGGPPADRPEGLAYAYFYRGNLHAVHRQDRPAAIADYRQALALDPRLASAAFNLGQALRVWAVACRAQGDEAAAVESLAQAIQAYDRAIEIDPGYPRAHGARGLAHSLLGRLDQAVADYRLELARGPRAETYHALGLALRDLGRLDEALDALERAVARAPGDGRYYFSRGRVLARLGDEDRAIADFRSYLRLASPADTGRRARVQKWLEERGVSD
jgi:tetratricopeptide (TPR) repeat protein